MEKEQRKAGERGKRRKAKTKRGKREENPQNAYTRVQYTKRVFRGVQRRSVGVFLAPISRRFVGVCLVSMRIVRLSLLFVPPPTSRKRFETAETPQRPIRRASKLPKRWVLVESERKEKTQRGKPRNEPHKTRIPGRNTAKRAFRNVPLGSV